MSEISILISFKTALMRLQQDKLIPLPLPLPRHCGRAPPAALPWADGHRGWRLGYPAPRVRRSSRLTKLRPIFSASAISPAERYVPSSSIRFHRCARANARINVSSGLGFVGAHASPPSGDNHLRPLRRRHVLCTSICGRTWAPLSLRLCRRCSAIIRSTRGAGSQRSLVRSRSAIEAADSQRQLCERGERSSLICHEHRKPLPGNTLATSGGVRLTGGCQTPSTSCLIVSAAQPAP